MSKILVLQGPPASGNFLWKSLEINKFLLIFVLIKDLNKKDLIIINTKFYGIYSYLSKMQKRNCI